jgi:hypothetical protein
MKIRLIGKAVEVYTCECPLCTEGGMHESEDVYEFNADIECDLADINSGYQEGLAIYFACEHSGWQKVEIPKLSVIALKATGDQGEEDVPAM